MMVEMSEVVKHTSSSPLLTSALPALGASSKTTVAIPKQHTRMQQDKKKEKEKEIQHMNAFLWQNSNRNSNTNSNSNSNTFGQAACDKHDFDPDTGCAITTAGEEAVARQWTMESDMDSAAGAAAGVGAGGLAVDNNAAGSTGTSTGGGGMFNFSFRVGYSTLSKATAGFSESHKVGGGGSCLVYRGQVYGVWVGIKAIKVKERTKLKVEVGMTAILGVAK